MCDHWIILYEIGISANSQEVVSTARRANKPCMKRHLCCSCVSPKPLCPLQLVPMSRIEKLTERTGVQTLSICTMEDVLIKDQRVDEGRSGIGRGDLQWYPSRLGLWTQKPQGYSWPEHGTSRCYDPYAATGSADHGRGGSRNATEEGS